MRLVYHVTICFLACVECLYGELFTSNANLQASVHAEKDIAKRLHSYVEQEQTRLDKIKQLADNYASHSQRVLTSPDMSLDNPVNAFLFIKRFTVDWDRDVQPLLSNNSFDALLQDIDSVRSNLPTYQDLTGAAAALLRLKDTYLLDVATVAYGNLNGLKSPQLSVDDCFELGKIFYENNAFYHSILWMQHALNERERERKYRERMREDDKKEEVVVVDSNLRLSEVDKDRVKMLEYIALAHYKMGYLRQALDHANELLAIDPTYTRWVENKNNFIKTLRDPSHQQKSHPHLDYQASLKEDYELLTYEALCRGEDVQPIEDTHKLTCQYRHNHHPLLLLSPAKEETVHLDPLVVVYHDVITNSEIRQLKHIVTPGLQRSMVVNATNGGEISAAFRTSQSSWLKTKDHPFNRRIGALTGLNMDTAEYLQFSNYGLGGHYFPHDDFFISSLYPNATYGNRIATFLTYLTDVEAGGATVFTELGLKVFPKKGTAVFWYNLYKSGRGNPRLGHAACPVLVGNKWVANSWIRESGQMFRRPCDTADDFDLDIDHRGIYKQTI